MGRPLLEAEALKKLRKADLLSFFNRYVAKGGAGRRLLTAQVFPRVQASTRTQPVDASLVSGVIEDELQFRAGLPTYPEPDAPAMA